jgi:hypothetical protein
LAVLIENTIEVIIDDAPGIGAAAGLRVRLPSPAAFIFNKGLVFLRRRERLKKGKDLYYIFDLLAYREDFKERTVADLRRLGERYKKWFKTFKGNLAAAFSDPGSDSVALTAQQRPSGVFSALNDRQMKQYIFATFQDFLSRLQ